MESYLLLIEDEMPIRSNVAELLTLNGFSVQTAATGKEGIWLATQQRPDLILCDVMMPGLDGFQTLEIIRANPALNTVPFLFLTAKNEATDTRKGMALGADDYLIKPFKLDTLLTAIKGRLQREAQRQANTQALLNQQIRAMSDLTTHEYNTPISVIMGFSTLLTSQYDDFSREEKLTMLNMMKLSALRLKRSLDNNRLIARLETISPHDSAYTVFSTGHTLFNAALVEDQLRSIQYRQDRSIAYRVAVESVQVAIATDNLRIILEELLDNACKFSTANQPILITSHQANDQYLLTIINDGQPFNVADMERIEAYRQFERGRYEQQGFGLGLAITKKLLTLNKGSLCINKLVSGETQVRVYLPNA